MKKIGFTLIELLIVIAIIAVLAGAMIPMFRSSRTDAQQAKVRSELDAIRTAAIMLHSDTGVWPATGTDGSILVSNNGTTNWNGPYLDAWRPDPWTNNYTLFNNTSAPPNLGVRTLGANNLAGGTGADLDISLLITSNSS